MQTENHLGVPYFLDVSRDFRFGCKDAKGKNEKDPVSGEKESHGGLHFYIQSSFSLFLYLSV